MTSAVLASTLTLAQSRHAALPLRFPGTPLEASGVVAVPDSNGVLVVADGSDHEVFWMELDQNFVGRPVVTVRIDANVLDPEDITTDGTYFYVVGSQSRDGGHKVDGLVRFRFDPASKRAGPVERVSGLEAILHQNIPDLRRLSGGRTGPLNIEGLVWDGPRQRLLFGLRSPLADQRALVAVARLKDPGRPLAAENLLVDGRLVSLNLGGLAIRGMGFDRSTGRVLIVGGGSTDESKSSYRLFDWDGAVGSSPRDLGPLRSPEKPEGVTRVTRDGTTKTMVVFDFGGYQVLD